VVRLELRQTAEHDLPGILAVEPDQEAAPWISRWSLQRHRRAII
jgi:hypothetical protein